MSFSLGALLPATGILNFVLIAFQVASGRHLISVPIQVHRRTGQILLVTAAVHGILALIAGGQ
jgi:hypothetical protein